MYMSQDNTNIAQDALNKLVETGVTSKVEEVEKIDINLQTNPLKAITGEIESVSLVAEGMIMKKDLRVEKIELHTDSISINPLKAVTGNLELSEPTKASMRVILTEVDINRALNSEYLGSKLENISSIQDDQGETVALQNIKCTLPGDNKIHLSTQLFWQKTGEVKQVTLSLTPLIDSKDSQHVLLENIEYIEGEKLSENLKNYLIEELKELLDWRKFTNNGLKMYLKELTVNEGKITVIGSADIEEIPTFK